MSKFRLLLFGFLAFTSGLILPSCVDVLEFRPSGDENILVVDGKLTLSRGVQTVRLSETSVAGRSDNFPVVTGARISLQDDAGNTALYIEGEPGVYNMLGSAIQPATGRTYVLRIEVNGKTYESKAELMPQTIHADSSYFGIANQKFVYAYTSIPIPSDIDRGPFLKWRIDNVYALAEVYCGPFDPTNV